MPESDRCNDYVIKKERQLYLTLLLFSKEGNNCKGQIPKKATQ